MATLESMTVRLGIDTDRLRAGAEKAKGVLAGLGKAVAGLGVGAPAAAAVAAGVGGMAAAFASAGVAAQAFQLAAGPQLAAVAEASTAAAKAEDAHDVATRKTAAAQQLASKGGKEYEAALREAASATKAAKDADAAYEQQLAGLPKSTRAMAKELAGLKKDHEEWSNSLADSTMPVFTKGLQIARRLLPLLTPFVEEAAKAFGSFVDEIDRSTRGKGLETFAQSMAKVAGQNLKSLLSGLKNIAVGVGGVIKAFLPLSTTMSGGFEESTAAFARWGQGLSDSEGFAQFVALAKQGGQTLGTLAQAALKLVVALGPLIGITSVVALQLAKIINALPPEVMESLAIAVVSAVVAFKAFKAASSAVESASALMNSRLGRLAGQWIRTAATSVASMVRIAVAATVNAARTAAAWAASAARATATWLATMIRVAAVTVARFVMMAARAVIWAATMAAQWLIAMGPVGWIIAAVIGLALLIFANWDRIKKWTLAAWDWVVGKLIWAKDMMIAAFMNFTLIGLIIKHWSTIKQKTTQAWNALVGWLRGIPGMIYNAFLNFTPIGLMIKHWSRIKTVAITKAQELVAWMRGLPGRISSGIGSLGSLLTGKGKDVIRGLWNGISSMGGWLWSKIKNFVSTNVVDAAKSFLQIGSPSKLMGDEIGRWLPPGIAEGAEDNRGVLDKSLQSMAQVPGLKRMARTPGTGGQPLVGRLALDITGGDNAFVTWFQSIVRTAGGGSVVRLGGGHS